MFLILEKGHFPTFTDLFEALSPTEHIDSRLFPILEPPRFNTRDVKSWSTEKQNKKYERSMRDQVKFGKEFARITGGAIMLICGDVPRQFSVGCSC